MRRSAWAVALIAVLLVLGCSRKDTGAGEVVPPKDAQAPAANPAETAEPAPTAPSPGRTTSAETIVSVKPKIPEPDFDNPPAEPTDEWILWFVYQMQEAYQRKDARYLLERMTPDVKIKFTNGDKMMEVDRSQWFTQTQTSLSFVRDYKYWVTDHKWKIDGKKVFLELFTLEEYVQPDGETVRGETYVTMDLEWIGDDFVIRTLTGETTGTPID